MDHFNARKIAPECLSLKEVFLYCHSLAIRTSREDKLFNKMSQDGVIICHNSSALYMMSHITFLQALRHNFCNCRE